MRTAAILVAILSLALLTNAQSCPARDSGDRGVAREPSVLHGTLAYHDELRQWLGLKLDQPVCGESEIQLVFKDAPASRSANSFRGCAVAVTGNLFESPTGYYSAELAISDAIIAPDSSCIPVLKNRDPSLAAIRQNLRIYYTSITVDYRGKGHVDVKVWEDARNRAALRPWQAYANYLLTGGEDVLWFGCRNGYGVGRVTQSPRPRNDVMKEAGLPDDAGTVLDMGRINTITFSCHMRPGTTQ